MSGTVNKAILIGRLGKDPDVRKTTNGNAVTTLSIATSDSWRDRQTGELKESTEWHRVVLFGRLAETAEKYLAKGARVYICGRFQTRKWVDRDGQERYTTEVVADELEMLGGNRGESGSSGGARSQSRPENEHAGLSDDVPDF